MAASDLTTEGHVAVAVAGAVVGAVVVAAAAPILVPVLGLGALGALAVSGSAAVGTAIGGWLGWKAGKPSETTVAQLMKK